MHGPGQPRRAGCMLGSIVFFYACFNAQQAPIVEQIVNA
jgi:hypothetical protein